MSCFPIMNIPRDIALEIFSFLPQEDLVRSSRVSKVWNRVANEALRENSFDPKKEFPTLKVIDAEVWETYVDVKALGLDAKGARPLDKRTDMPALKQLISSLDIEGDAGITLLTIPKDLTLNKLDILAKSPKQGNPTGFKYIDERILEELGDISALKTYQVAITNSVLNGSRNLDVEKQKELAIKNGCEMPSVVEAVALAFLTFMSSSAEAPTRLYNDNPWTYTRCLEEVDGYSLLVGGFAPDGLHSHRSNGYYDHFGVGALRKFLKLDNRGKK